MGPDPAGFFLTGVRIDNRAAGGRSTKTFRSENRWAALLEQKPEVILIQFGHNDSHAADKPEATTPEEYYQNLLRYVKEAREAGSLPVLITPPHRRIFRNGALSVELEPYAAQMRRAAAETGCALIDLWQLSGELLQPLGDAGCLPYFCSATDRSHFSRRGATELARLVAEQLRTLSPEVAKFLRPQADWPKPEKM